MDSMKAAVAGIFDIIKNALAYIFLALLGSTAKAFVKHKDAFSWKDYFGGALVCVTLAICMSELFLHFNVPCHLGNAIIILVGYSSSDILKELSKKTVAWVGRLKI
jgi:hypothetical protein